MTAVKFDLNAYLLDSANLKGEFNTPYMQARGFRQVAPITCADGLSLSVQASQTHYCAPRDSIGPWTEVEIGYPSQRVEELLAYAENSDDPTETVYAYVPVEVVEAVIEKHGGLKA
jgi:hypothetical protein